MAKKVLLVCGGGASTGFLAAAIRKAVKKVGADYNVDAKPIDSLENNLSDLDVLLVAPHFEFRLDELKKKISGTRIKMAVVSPEAYGIMDGNAILEQINSLLEEEKA
jgi:PTS system cellobiose-specific IIB component